MRNTKFFSFVRNFLEKTVTWTLTKLRCLVKYNSRFNASLPAGTQS